MCERTEKMEWSAASYTIRTILKGQIELQENPTFYLDLLWKWYYQFSSVQSLSRVRLFATPWIAAHQASLSITNSWSSLRLNVHRVRDAIQPSHPLSPSPPAPNPSQHQSLFQLSWPESTPCMRWPKYWSFSFSIIPSKEHPGLIFRMDWLDLLAVQGTLKSLLQHHSSKASILHCSAFFTVQLSHPYMPLGKP